MKWSREIAHHNTRNPAVREGIVSVLVNIFLFVLKLWAGVASGSIALIVDAWHSISDSLTSIFIIISARISSRKPDKNFPFGYGRVELITALIVGIFLGVVAFEFLVKSIERLIRQEEVLFGSFAIIVTVTSVILNEGLAQYAFWVGRKIDSRAVKADGWHHRSDALSSIIVLIGILLSTHYWWIDGVLGILVALLLFYATYGILADTIGVLLGRSPNQKFIKIIHAICMNVTRRDLHIHHIHCHEYGAHKELTFHIRLPSTMTLKESHEIADLIEMNIRKEKGMEATIHVEPLLEEVS